MTDEREPSTFQELLEFMRRPEVRRQADELTRREFEIAMANFSIIKTLDEMANETETGEDGEEFRLMSYFLSTEAIGLIFDYKDCGIAGSNGIKFEEVDLPTGKSALVIKFDCQFAESCIPNKDIPNPTSKVTKEKLQEMAFEALGVYKRLILDGKFVPFENLDRDTVRRLYE